jgi:acid stress-induced BolA-like protein IbaG/YrbA
MTAMEPSQIKELIEGGLPGAVVKVTDLTGTRDHFEALVVSALFEGKTRVERHQAVYRTLGDAMRGPIHALKLKALTPSEHQERR